MKEFRHFEMTDFARLSPKNTPKLWRESLRLDNLHQQSQQTLAKLDFSQHTPPKLAITGTDNLTNRKSGDSDNEGDKYQNNVNVNVNEKKQTTWLITLFNQLFHEQNITLTHATDVGRTEPEYLPATKNHGQIIPAKICFAHGFFASALHEISHWTIAGDKRRLLTDFGYWYAPDGRNEQQQQDFEKVEIKPQAIECLLTLACGRAFTISQDNLFADFDTSNSTFEADVFELATKFLHQPSTLPRDAQTLLMVLYQLCAKI